MGPSRIVSEGAQENLPRAKYEEKPSGETAALITRFAFGFVLANAFLLFKNIAFPGSSKATEGASENKLEDIEIFSPAQDELTATAEAATPEDASNQATQEPPPPAESDLPNELKLGVRPIAVFAKDDALIPIEFNLQAAKGLQPLNAAGNDNGTPPPNLASVANNFAESHMGGGEAAASAPTESGASTGDRVPSGPSRYFPEADEEKTEDDYRFNQAPLIASMIVLDAIYADQSLSLGLEDLLEGVVDPDGDVLGIRQISSSAGELTPAGDKWLFQPDEGFIGEVYFAYEITDGLETVVQFALLEVETPPGIELTGTEGDDRLIGTPGEDLIDGLEGDDIIIGLASRDILNGGDGDDTIEGEGGDDIINGGAGDDLVFGGTGNDTIHGGDGSDSLYGGAGNDFLFGDDGDDLLFGEEGDDNLLGGDGNDRMDGGVGDDFLMGGLGDDFLDGGDGDDLLFGNEGADRVYGGSGNDVFGATDDDGDDDYSAGDGIDTLDFGSVSAGVSVDLNAGTSQGARTGSDQISGFENVKGTEANDTVTGDDGANEITGNGGNDALDGGGGTDVFHATIDDGDDTYTGGEGTDLLDLSKTFAGASVDLRSGSSTSAETGTDLLSGIENVRGSKGNDTIVSDDAANILHGEAGNDTFVMCADGVDDHVNGGHGSDTADYGEVTMAISADLETGVANGEDIGTDSLTSIENLLGTSAGDQLSGNSADNEITGNGGNDEISGHAGDDVFKATVDDGDDTFDGGEGTDTLDLSATSAGATVDLEEGTASSDEIGTDSFANIENVFGSSGGDRIIANDQMNVFHGGDGDDIFVFRSTLSAGYGGNRDKIMDFEIGDRIDLDDISREFADEFEDTLRDEGIRKFVLISENQAFSKPGELKLRYEEFRDHEITIVSGNIDYVDDAEFEIELYGRHMLDNDHFYWHS